MVDKLEKFSLKGLRTLCYAMKVLSEDEWSQIKKKLDAVNKDPDRENKLE